MILRPRFWLVLAATPTLFSVSFGGASLPRTHLLQQTSHLFLRLSKRKNSKNHHPLLITLPITLQYCHCLLLETFNLLPSVVRSWATSNPQDRNKHHQKGPLLCSSALLLQNESDLHTPSCSHSPVMYCIDVSRVQQTSSMSRSIRRGVRC